MIEQIQREIKVCPKCKIYNCYTHEACCHNCFLRMHDVVLIKDEGELYHCGLCEKPIIDAHNCLGCSGYA